MMNMERPQSLFDYITNDSWNDRCMPCDQSNYCPMAELFPDEDIKPFVPKRGYPDYHQLDLRLQAVQRLQAPPSSCFQDNHYPNLPEAPFRESSKPVDFLNVKGVYEKIQCRKNKQSKQRLAGATIDMMATFSKQIRHVEVCVQRCAKAAALCGDSNGEVPLKPKIESCHLTEGFQWQQFFSVDLDSVYMSHKGTPVYKLSTMDSDHRNRFRLVVYVTFTDGTRMGPYYSEFFLLRSKRSRLGNRPY